MTAGRRSGRAPTDRLGQGEPVELRHQVVERGPRSKRSPASIQARASTDDPVSRDSIPQRASWAVRIRRFVALSSTTRTRRPASSIGSIATAGGVAAATSVLGEQGEGERAALAGDAAALDRQVAAHRLGQAPADRQPEAGAAVPAGDAHVELAERLEEPVAPLRRDADARCRGRRRSAPRSAASRPSSTARAPAAPRRGRGSRPAR